MTKKITSIEVQKNNKERFNIYLDGEFAFGISMDTLVKHHLTKGQSLTTEYIRQIESTELYYTGYQRAIRYLSFKKRSAKELKTHLSEDQLTEEDINRLVQKLTDQGYIDDEDYITSFVRTALNTTQKGPKRVKQELLNKVGQNYVEEIDSVIRDYFTDDIIHERLNHLIQKEDKPLSIPKRKHEQKVLLKLIRKGYERHSIEEVLKHFQFDEKSDVIEDKMIRDLEKKYKKVKHLPLYERKQKYMAMLMMKQYEYDKIKEILEGDLSAFEADE